MERSLKPLQRIRTSKPVLRATPLTPPPQIVFNPSTYPNFLRFLKLYPALKAAIVPTEMTFSVSRDAGAFEWAGNNLRSVFCQPARLLDRRMWRLLYDVLRFNACARRLVAQPACVGSPEISIGQYLERNGYSDAFRDDYLIVRTLPGL